MKIAVECKSLLLQKALENFLGKHLCSSKQAQIVVHDYKSDDPRSFFVASRKDEGDLVKPFSKSQLFLALQNRYKTLQMQHKDGDEPTQTPAQQQNFEILQKRIEMLTSEYQKNIIEAIKAFYG